jgi:hypothetical protein
MSTDKGIADAMIAKGYDLENIYNIGIFSVMPPKGAL